MSIVVMRSTHELRLGQVPALQLARRSLAEAAVWKAAAVIKADDPAVDHLQETWATGMDPQTQQPLLADVPLGEGRFSAAVVDEQRKPNLNTASPALLQKLIERLAPAADAGALAAAIADWRDEPLGQSCADAAAACHNAPFETVDELAAVPGMTPEFFAALRPAVTVYGDGKINVNTASAEVLADLGLNAEVLIGQREHQPFTAPPEEGSALLSVAATHFTVSASAVLNQSPGAFSAEAVIDRQGRILAWRRVEQ